MPQRSLFVTNWRAEECSTGSFVAPVADLDAFVGHPFFYRLHIMDPVAIAAGGASVIPQLDQGAVDAIKVAFIGIAVARRAERVCADTSMLLAARSGVRHGRLSWVALDTAQRSVGRAIQHLELNGEDDPLRPFGELNGETRFTVTDQTQAVCEREATRKDGRHLDGLSLGCAGPDTGR